MSTTNNGYDINSVANAAPAASRQVFKWFLRPIVKSIQKRWPNELGDARPWWILQLANIISALRLLSAPGLAIVLAGCRTRRARRMIMLFVVIIILSDGIDGELARDLETESDFGKFLDRLADKCLIGALLWATVKRYDDQQRLSWALLLPTAILAYLEIRNVVVSEGTVRLVRKHGYEGELKGANHWGKIKFALECAAVVRFYDDEDGPQHARTCFFIIAAIPFAWLSLRGYEQERANLKRELSL